MDGPEGEADAEVQPETEGHGLEDEDSVAGGFSAGRCPGLVSFAPSGPLVVASGEESHPIPQPEPATPAAGDPVPQNEPSPPAGGDPIPQLVSGIRSSAGPGAPTLGRDQETCARPGADDPAVGVPASAGREDRIPPEGGTPTDGGSGRVGVPASAGREDRIPPEGGTPTGGSGRVGVPASAGPVGLIPPKGATPAPAGGEAAPSDPHHRPMPQDEPSPATSGEGIPQNEPTTPAAGDPIPRNEPSPSVGGDPRSENEPTGSGRIADSSVPALVCALVILLAAGLSAAFAGPIGKPSLPADGQSGPAAASVDSDRPGPFESAHRRQGPERIGRGIHARRSPGHGRSAGARRPPDEVSGAASSDARRGSPAGRGPDDRGGGPDRRERRACRGHDRVGPIQGPNRNPAVHDT